MPGRKEQNQRDLKKACANYYQLDTFFKGIGKRVNESKKTVVRKIKTHDPNIFRYYK